MVSGVVIQGGKHRDRNVFMKRFKVGHSLNGEEWTVVKEDNTTRPKVGSVTRPSDWRAYTILKGNLSNGLNVKMEIKLSSLRGAQLVVHVQPDWQKELSNQVGWSVDTGVKIPHYGLE